MAREIKYPNLKAEMARHGESQEKLAKIIGITQQTFSRKMLGINEWTIGEIEAICEHYKKDYYQLFK